MNTLKYIRAEPQYNVNESSVSKAEELLSNTLAEFGTPNQDYEPSDNIVSGIEKATELVLWQLSRLNKMHKQTIESILKAECKASTDLERLHQLGSRFINPTDTRAAQLKDRLVTLEEKRRQAELAFFERQSKCLEKLTTLVGRHKLMTPPQHR